MSSLNLNLPGPDHPLRALRHEAGLSQAALGSAGGICQAAVSHVESGGYLHRGGAALACARALDVELPAVLGAVQLELYRELDAHGLIDVWTGEAQRELHEVLVRHDDAEGVA